MNKRFTSMGAALAALATGLLIATPAAAAKTSPVTATYKLAPGVYDVEAGPDAMWAVRADEVHDALLYRIDPRSRGMKLVTTLPFAAGAMTVAFGSEWVSDYFGNKVWRLDPSGHVQAQITVGLQPQWLHAAFGSIWSSNHHDASLSRIDPATNTVVATASAGAPGVFRSGPQGLTDDGANLYVLSSNQQALQSVNPATDATTTYGPIDDAGCGPLAAIAGVIWSVDACTGAFYQLSADGVQQLSLPSAGSPGGLTTRGSELWISDDTTFDQNTFTGSNAVLEQLDPLTGKLLRAVPIGGDAVDIASGFGDLWVYDGVANTIRRVTV